MKTSAIKDMPSGVMRRALKPIRRVILICLLLLSGRLDAAGDAPQGGGGRVPVIRLDSGYKLILFPAQDVYPPYLADPHRSGFAFQRLYMLTSEIADSGSSRYNLKAGGRIGLVRLAPPNGNVKGVQISIVAGFDAQFDTDRNYDNIGWDGNYGIALAGGDGDTLALKFAVLHTSGHVGDEYAERTGRQRIGYTRTELQAGISLFLTGRLRGYAEMGWGYDLKNEELQEPGRLQAGLEFRNNGSLWKGRLGWYAAADLSTMEERNWHLDASFQTGLIADSSDHTWRFGIEYYDGRPTMAEFFRDTESYVSLGLWLDV